jgi:hypothetical protein
MWRSELKAFTPMHLYHATAAGRQHCNFSVGEATRTLLPTPVKVHAHQMHACEKYAHEMPIEVHTRKAHAHDGTTPS